MLKSDLVARVAEKIPHIAVKTINDSVNHLIQQMNESLANHQRIEIRGFGSFSIKHRTARQARNPKTKEKVITSDKIIPHFKPGSILRAHINASQKSTAIHEE
jgi:integration host factor subunit beta